MDEIELNSLFWHLWDLEAPTEKNCRVRSGDYIRIFVKGGDGKIIYVLDGTIDCVEDRNYCSKREVLLFLGSIPNRNQSYLDKSPEIGRFFAVRGTNWVKQDISMDWSGNPNKTWHIENV